MSELITVESIDRSYIHKGGKVADPVGLIGSVDLHFPVDGWSLNGHGLNSQSVTAIVNHGLQIFQDTYAGIGASKTEDEGRAAYASKVFKVENNLIGVSRGSEPAEYKHIRNAVLKTLTDNAMVKYSAIEGDDKTAERKTFLMNAFDALAADSEDRSQVTEYARLMVEVDRQRAADAEIAKTALKGIKLNAPNES